jgi:hypothetical protein
LALGQSFLRVRRFSPTNITPPWLSISIHDLGDGTMGPLVTVFQRHSLIPSTWVTETTRYDIAGNYWILTEWFSFCPNITWTFCTIAIIKSFVKQNNNSNKTCSRYVHYLFTVTYFICVRFKRCLHKTEYEFKHSTALHLRILYHKSCSSFKDVRIQHFTFSRSQVDWCKSCMHLRSLDVRHCKRLKLSDIYYDALMKQVVITSERSVNIYRTTRRNIQEHTHLHTRSRKILKSHLVFL